MNSWHFYRLSDGVLIGRTYTGQEADLPINTPEACGAVRGHFDHARQRVNLCSGQVEDWQPPPPDNEMMKHEWDAEARRWLARPTLAALKHTALSAARGDIDRIETGQARALREALTADDADTKQVALGRLLAIDARIETHRQQMLRIAAAIDEQSLDALLLAQKTPIP